MEETLFSQIALLLGLGIGAQWLAWQVKLPSILLLLVSGFLAGPVFGWLHPEALLGEALFPLVSLSVGLILFEGGLTLRASELRSNGNVVWSLISVGALITWVLSSVFAYAIAGLPISVSLVLGAVLVVTGPTVVGPLLNHIRPTGAVNSILKWEGIVIDPVGATLALLVFEAVVSGRINQAAGTIVMGMLATLLVGSGAGLLGAVLLVVLFRRYWVPDQLQNPLTIMVVVGTFVLSNHYQHESGLLAVTLMGIIMANQRFVSVRHIVEFKENLRVLLIGILFILLTARLHLDDFRSIGLPSFLFLLAVILVVRPLAVLVSTWRTSLKAKERMFLAWMAPRGIVAASVASIFAQRMTEAGIPGAERLVPVIFVVIAGTVLIYSLTAGPLAYRLGVARPNPQGVLIVGANPVARMVGQALHSLGFQVLLVDTNKQMVEAARADGLSAQHTNVLQDEDHAELDIGGVGRMLALTPNDEVNALVALEFAHVFGSERVYRLAPKQVNGSGHSVPSHLRGRVLFGETITYDRIQELLEGGAQLQVMSGNGAMAGAVPLFTVNDNGLLSMNAVDSSLELQPTTQVATLNTVPG